MPGYENKLFNKIKSKVQEQKKYNKHGDIKIYSHKEMEESENESQNFCLKLSENSVISDTQNIVSNDGKDIIIISDSSSNCSSPKYLSQSKFKSNKYLIESNKTHILDSSDSDYLDTEDEKFFQARRANKKYNFYSHNQTKKNIVNRNNALYTSDDTSSTNSEQNQKFVQSSNKSSSKYIISTSRDNIKVASKTNIASCIGSTDSSKSSKSFKSSDQPTKTSVAINKNCSNMKKKLTRKDVQNIMKNIKSTKIVYESPRQRKENTVVDESIDIHPAISFKDNIKLCNKIIDETPVSSESDVIQGFQVNMTNCYETHGNEVLNVPDIDTDVGIMHTELSERKKKQISQWLMTSSLDVKSDSSFSIVPPTNNNVSSGNSSLERLEMNYETPNNRGKVLSNVKRINNDSTNQNVLTLRTAEDSHINNNIPQHIDIADCANILDKIYGNVWREKAEVLLSKSVPQKQVISTRNRAVQTERKGKNKRKPYMADSEDDDFDTSLKDIQLQKQPTNKNATKNTKQRDSFINDETLSESGSESLYHTALTNPRISDSAKPKPTFSSNVQRLLTICDTDTEDTNDNSNGNRMHSIQRKKLSFSEDESEDSSTSEFDPGDNVPPKFVVRKDLIKTSRQVSKINVGDNRSLNKQKYEKCHSFLASLSESVPIANVHPDAKKYRTDYKNNKENLCKHLFKLYNENVFDKSLPEDMSIEWNVRMRGTAGFCYNKKSIKTLGGIVRSSRIVLAMKVLDTPDRLRDTLIHEMCHAAAWLINNVSDGHGPFWTGWAKKAMKAFPELPPIRRCHDYKIKTKFTYKCTNCGYSIGRHSKSLNVENKRCGHCYGKFELLTNKTTKSGIVQVQTPKREPTGFALYVKENYNFIKKERNVRHAEVMKILGQQFSAIKIAKKQENLINDPDIPG